MRLRYLTAGESHGPGLVVVVEGLPAGLEVGRMDIAGELERRRLGYGRGARMKLEADDFEILGGIRHGRTLGSPVSVLVRNTEFPTDRWASVMAVDPPETPVARETRPRPGHADLVGMLKYGFRDARNVLERSSARETAARTVAGVLAKALLSQVGAAVVSHVVQIGTVRVAAETMPRPGDLETVESSPVRCLDAEAETRMIEAIEQAKADGDTLGGVFEVVAHGTPPGLGSYVHWDRKLDGRLAQALMSINAMKGVGIGDGFASAAAPGSRVHDEIFWSSERGYHRTTDRSGGIEGGVSTGEPIRASVAMKPLSTLRKALRTVDIDTKQEALAIVERSDVCAVPSACVVGEAVVAFTLADALLEKLGGDSVDEVLAAHRRLQESVAGS
jgi:chorismate synthase